MICGMKGSHLLAACLAESGVERVYGLIGTSIVGFVDGLYHYKERIRYITTRHEQVTASMADAEGRLSGKPGVCALHAGPGLLHAAISIADAFKDSSPLLCIAGGVQRRHIGRDGFVEVDTHRVFKTLTNGIFSVKSAAEIPHAFKQAYEACYQNGKGPAILEVPEDVWLEETDAQPVAPIPPSPPAAQSADVERVADLFLQAERPLLLFGAGAKGVPAEAIRSLAETYQVPVVTTGNGRGILSEKDPYCLGAIGFVAQNPPADKALTQADLLIAFGATLSDLSTYMYTAPLPPKVVVVNVSEKARQVYPEADDYFFVDAVGFYRAFAEALSGKEGKVQEAWLSSLQKERESWRAQLRQMAQNASSPLSGSYVMERLSPRLPEKFIYSGGAGVHVVYAMHYLPVTEPGQFLMAHNFGAMGYAFAGALGAKLAKPDHFVFSVIGDGDFGMTLQDLETAVREKIDSFFVVMNDNAYRALLATQRIQFGGREYGSRHQNPDFARLAEAFGAKGYRMEKPDEVEKVFDEALAADGVRVIDVQIDPNDAAPLNFEAVIRMKSAMMGA